MVLFIGLGYCCSSAGLVVALGFYFRRWRNHVISLSYVLVGFGIFTAAPFGLYIIETYGIRSAFLIMACVNLQICVVGMISRPSSIERKVQSERLNGLEETKGLTPINKEEKTFRLLFNVALLKQMSFVCFLVSTASWNFGLTVAIMHLPNYMRTDSGNEGQTGIIMTAFSIGHIIGRVLGCLGVSKGGKLPLLLHIGSLGIGGSLTAAFPLYSQHFSGKLKFSIILGLSCGVPSSMATVLSTMFVGVAMLPEAYSFIYFFGGIGVTTGPVVAGELITITSEYLYPWQNVFVSWIHCFRIVRPSLRMSVRQTVTFWFLFLVLLNNFSVGSH